MAAKEEDRLKKDVRTHIILHMVSYTRVLQYSIN